MDFSLSFSLDFSLSFSLDFSLSFSLSFSLDFSLSFSLDFSLGFSLILRLIFILVTISRFNFDFRILFLSSSITSQLLFLFGLTANHRFLFFETFCEINKGLFGMNQILTFWDFRGGSLTRCLLERRKPRLWSRGIGFFF